MPRERPAVAAKDVLEVSRRESHAGGEDFHHPEPGAVGKSSGHRARVQGDASRLPHGCWAGLFDARCRRRRGLHGCRVGVSERSSRGEGSFHIANMRRRLEGVQLSFARHGHRENRGMKCTASRISQSASDIKYAVSGTKKPASRMRWKECGNETDRNWRAVIRCGTFHTTIDGAQINCGTFRTTIR
jgi:hypothetical protein